mmetsp:Transcript_35451/g.56830  ORF Transcript_35451/g.56830 Transcript_35451/m.56830 type:complete len:195 (+) Transcript_35451:58-642(+)
MSRKGRSRAKKQAKTEEVVKDTEMEEQPEESQPAESPSKGPKQEDKNAQKKQAKKKLTKEQLKVKRRKKALKAKYKRQEQILAARAKAASKFQVRCRKPVEDEIFDVDEFVKYLKERFKVNGRTGQVGPARPVNIQKSSSTVHVMSKKPFPKYYIKYLTKRYLKRHGLRDYVRVIADKKQSYELRYFNIQEDKQ